MGAKALTRDIKQLKLVANAVRQSIIRSLAEAKSGHSAGSLGFADVFTALYFGIAKHDPRNPDWADRDRIVLSHGHVVPVRYAAMAEAGYFPKEELMTLRKLNTRLHGHPHNEALPGLESSAGPLGQGVSIAVGMALTAKLDQKNHFVYLLTSDGESNEGQVWEAYMFAAKNKLDHLIAILDRNYIQIDGNTENVMPLEPLAEKFRAFNMHVLEMDGNDMKQVMDALEKARKLKGKPTMIIANTIPGKGVSFMEKNYLWHGKAPNPEEAEKALAELNAEKTRLENEG
ncbi:transketolase [Candidatus Micrarchaeota archaeon]|nr:transketolase [Candidatus Micrarchaeota archaeon]